ncbi:MAG: hypothetical protein M1834_008452 [Cirrosporium novae-zelandiae]|nr:MAG: hypothetical protein M1834_008452 [Cirrosporium novae-zelandiae]
MKLLLWLCAIAAHQNAYGFPLNGQHDKQQFHKVEPRSAGVSGSPSSGYSNSTGIYIGSTSILGTGLSTASISSSTIASSTGNPTISSSTQLPESTGSSSLSSIGNSSYSITLSSASGQASSSSSSQFAFNSSTAIPAGTGSLSFSSTTRSYVTSNSSTATFLGTGSSPAISTSLSSTLTSISANSNSTTLSSSSLPSSSLLGNGSLASSSGTILSASSSASSSSNANNTLSISKSMSSGSSSASSSSSISSSGSALPGSLSGITTASATTTSLTPSQSSDLALLPTITPSSVSTESVSTITGVTQNTEITTTDSDGHTTIVPFFWHCWFCGGGGILAFGIGSTPAIYPPPPNPPIVNWPTITIGNDYIPTPGPESDDSDPTGSGSQSSTASSTSSSSSCTQSTVVTDFYVSCTSASAGASSSSCVTSTSFVTGCDETGTTTTTVGVCSAVDSDSDDSLPEGFVDGAEYPRVNLDYTTDGWTYTVAVIASTGVVTAAPGSASGSATMASSTIPPSSINITSTFISSSASSSASVSSPSSSVANATVSSLSTFSTSIISSSSSVNLTSTVPMTSMSSPTPTSSDPYPYTKTDIENGEIIACESSSVGNAAGYAYTVCEGDSTTVGLVTSIAVRYSSVVAAASASSASAASASSASAAAAASASAAAVPTASCAFYDEALYWTFVVYDMNSWVDDGSSLKDEEGGCGDMTGWKFNTDDEGISKAQFNLPFFMKSGCVERAIASAGGPSGLSCDGNGLDLKTAQRQKVAELAVSKLATTEDKRDLNEALGESPMSPANASSMNLFEKREILKRGCLDWIFGPNIPKEWWCNALIPGVDECIAQIEAKGAVGTGKVSLFYTGWGGTLLGRGDLATKKWARQNLCGTPWVDWDGIVSLAWRMSTELAIDKPFGKKGLNKPIDERDAIVDPFLKHLSQAYAEKSAGDVYVFIPEGVYTADTWDDNSAWGGWEYPALTRNDDVKRIYRVDLNTDDQDHPTGTPRVIWTQGDGKSSSDPKGTRSVSLPSGIPSGQVPDEWEDSL